MKIKLALIAVALLATSHADASSIWVTESGDGRHAWAVLPESAAIREELGSIIVEAIVDERSDSTQSRAVYSVTGCPTRFGILSRTDQNTGAVSRHAWSTDGDLAADSLAMTICYAGLVKMQGQRNKGGS